MSFGGCSFVGIITVESKLFFVGTIGCFSFQKMGITVAVVDGWLEYRCVNEGTFELLVEIRTALQDIFTGFYKSSLRDGSITTENKAVLAATEKLFQPPPVEELFDAGFSKILLGGTEGR